MKAPGSWAALLLCLSYAHSLAVAQKTPALRTVPVVVADAHTEPAQPVPTVRVSLGFLDGSVQVTESRDVTNPKGQAWLEVSEDAAQRGGLRVEITGTSNLVIYQPADGQLPALPATINISMLPKGSPALLGPAQIEAMLHRTLLQVNSLQKQVSALKAGAAQAQQPDLGAAIAGWAQANGFSSAKADEQVQQWAEAIQKQSGQATAEQKALAELALKHYAAAAQLFNQASDADRQEIGAEDAEEQALEAQMKALQAAQQALLDKRQSSLRQLLDDSEQAAGADQLNLKYQEARQALETAAATAQGEYKKHPGDKGFHELWLRALSDTANARRKEGEVAPADQSLPLLTQAADEFQSLANEYSTLNDRPEIAAAQGGLGMALVREGERAGGAKAMALLDQAVQALRSALEVRTKAALPQDWAWTQNGLGLALWDEGTRSGGGDKATALLGESVQAFKSALEVRTKADLPQDWAQTEMNLGIALMAEGNLVAGSKAMDFFDQAVQAYQNALQIYNKADLPLGWAWTEQDLGVALVEEGDRAGGDKAMDLIDQGVQAFKHALEIETKTDLPQDWARTESNLGYALRDEAERATGDKAIALLDQAVQAVRGSLEVFTKADLPQDWARAQMNLGSALLREGERSSGDKATTLFDQAAQAFRGALEVYTKADLPHDWAGTEQNLGVALVDEGQLSAGDKAVALLDQAVQQYQNALEVRTKANLPIEWAETQYDLGIALAAEGQRAGGDKGAALLDQAVKAYRSALEIYSKAETPQNWFITEQNLMGLYHDGTFQFDDALTIGKELADFNPSADNRMNLLEAELTAADLQECIQQAAKLDDQALAQQKVYMPVRDVIRFACLWGAGENVAALAADQRILARVQADPSYSQSGWSFIGTMHFLSASPAFEKGRSFWIALFTAVQNGDSAGTTAALHQLEPLLQQ
jgi:tetratricopeptide (TPR) repeat protein